MSDLLERLRDSGEIDFHGSLAMEAADRIEELERQLTTWRGHTEETYTELLDIARARIDELEAGFAWLKEFVDAQAEDAGLWAEAEYASEAYIQRGLRGCHAAIEKALAALGESEKVSSSTRSYSE